MPLTEKTSVWVEAKPTPILGARWRSLADTCYATQFSALCMYPSINSLDLHIASGGCFYMGTHPSRWVFLELEDDGSLIYGWSPNGKPGGHTVIGTASPCSWTRVEREEIEGYVWSEIGDYAHQSPLVSFDPPIPRGLVGIETFAALGTPAPWMYSSTSPYTGISLQAEVRVRQVRIDWDDGPPGGGIQRWRSLTVDWLSERGGEPHLPDQELQCAG